MSIPLVLWIVIALALAVVYTRRKIVVGGSDELVHLSDVSDGVLAKQEATARNLNQLDRLITVLTVVFLVYGVLYGAWTIYAAFTSSTPGA